MLRASKILFVTLSNIGDCILTLPVLDRLRSNFPTAEITVIVAPRPAEIFRGSPAVNKVLIYDKHAPLREKVKLLGSLRKTGFDLIVDLRNSAFSWLVPARRKSSWWPAGPADTGHRSQSHLSRLSGLGLKFDPGSAAGRSLAVRLEDQEQVDRLFQEAGIRGEGQVIVIAPGARSLTKRWPREKFLELINSLGRESAARIVLIGDRDDAATGNFLRQNAKVKVLDLTGRTSILQAAAVLKRAALLITNDSANLHLASYLDVPVVAIFGPTDEMKYGPWSKKSRVVKKELFCRPCRQALCRFGDQRCLRRVSVEDVLRAVREIRVTCLPAGRQVTAPEQEYKRILIVRTDRVGDVVLSTPVIKALRDAFPCAYLAMAVRPYTRSVVEGNPFLDEVIVYDKAGKESSWLGTFLFSRAISSRKFDLAVVLNPSYRSNLIPFLAGIKKRVGYDRKSGFLLTDRVKDTKQEGKKHEIEYNLDLVRVLGIEPRDKSTLLPVSPESEKWVDEVFLREGVLAADKLVAINPGASEDSKRWPAERFARVADTLAGRGYKIVILGGQEDKKTCAEVVRGLHCPFIDMIANNNISQAVSLLKRCRLFISSDTGPMHIASSLGTPVVTILGRSRPGLGARRWGPHNANSVIIQKDVGCVECRPDSCAKGFLCLASVSPEDVVTAAESLLLAPK